MALSFNPFLKGAGGLPSGFLNSTSGIFGKGSSKVIRIYPNTVAYPASSIEGNASLPAGFIYSVSIPDNQLIASNNSIVNTGAAISANTTAAGTFGWFTLFGFSYPMISDSIGLAGSGSILSVSSMTPTSGQSITVNFNLAFV